MNTFKISGQIHRFNAVALGCCLLIAAGLSGCDKNDGTQTAGQKLDAAVASTERVAADAKAKAETSMAKAGDAMKDATQKAQASGGPSADKIGTAVEDAAITASIASELVKDADLSAVKIDVDTNAGVVTLNGPAPTVAASNKATTIAKRIKGVVSVNNKLVVKSS